MDLLSNNVYTNYSMNNVQNTQLTRNSNNSGIQVVLPSEVGVLDKNDFLNMFMAQLQNQDPLNPADSSELASQMAQFSTLEQLTNINDQLSYLGVIGTQMQEVIELLKSNKTQDSNVSQQKETSNSEKISTDTDDELQSMTITYDFSNNSSNQFQEELKESLTQYIVSKVY